MTLALNDVVFGAIGDLVKGQTDVFGWIDITLYFTDSDNGTNTSITFNVAVDYEVDWTVRQIHQAAFEKAQDLLKAASPLLDQYDSEGLRQYAASLPGFEEFLAKNI